MDSSASGLRPRLPHILPLPSPGPPAARTPTCETRSPTSHLFWQKQLEWQQRCACCRGATASSPCWGAGLHSEGPCARACEWSYQQIAGLQPGDVSQSQDGQTCSEILSTQLPELGRGMPAAPAPASAGDSQGRGPAGSRSRNHGDGGGGWRRCGRLPAAGWEWFFPRPSHCRADLKRQPARLCLHSQQSQTTHLKMSPKKEAGGPVILFLKESSKNRNVNRKLIWEEFSRSLC